MMNRRNTAHQENDRLYLEQRLRLADLYSHLLLFVLHMIYKEGVSFVLHIHLCLFDLDTVVGYKSTLADRLYRYILQSMLLLHIDCLHRLKVLAMRTFLAQAYCLLLGMNTFLFSLDPFSSYLHILI